MAEERQVWEQDNQFIAETLPESIQRWREAENKVIEEKERGWEGEGGCQRVRKRMYRR